MNFRRWIKLDRLIPATTILFSFLAQVLDILNLIDLSIGENIVLLLVSLLAVDALSERLTVLEEIRSDIRAFGKQPLTASEFLSDRSSLPTLEESFRSAKSVDIAGMSLLKIATSQHDLIGKVAKKGCKIRLLLLNPENDTLVQSTCAYIASQDPETQRQEIKTSLRVLVSEPNIAESKLVEIRLSDHPLPHGLFISNGQSSSGRMRIEMYLYGIRPNRTPGINITREVDKEMYTMFWEEFERLWAAAKPLGKK